MKRAYFFCLFLCLTTAFLLSQSNPLSLVNQTAEVGSPIDASQTDPQAQARILDGYGKLPLSFEANQGQADARVKFLSRTSGYSLFLTGDEAVLALRGSKAKSAKASSGDGKLRSGMAGPMVAPTPGPTTETTTGAVLRMKLRNANPAAKVTGVDELAGTSNYFIGNDPNKWRSNVPTYAKVKYEGIYPGIDLVYYGNQRELEYDFVLQPGVNPGAIRLGIEGASRLRLDHGDLAISSSGGDVRLRRPYTYQEVNGRKQDIRGRYVINNKNEVVFRVASYDRNRPLIIDPVLSYSTYLGGSVGEGGQGIAVDTAGNAYVTGWTDSTDFPTVNALQRTYHGDQDAFVTKINADGSALVYSTYLGGSGFDVGAGIAVDSAGNAYVTGWTDSTDFPTVNPIQPAFHGVDDAFVAKIDSYGTRLVYSTYLGGKSQEVAAGIATDAAGNAYVTGYTESSDFPRVNAIQTSLHGVSDLFVTKINADGSAFVYSTYVGGSSNDVGNGIAVDGAGNAYLTGLTQSTDFPTVSAIQPTLNGGSDAFVTKINASGSAFIYSTYLGGSSFQGGEGIAVDGAGNAYVTGTTDSTDFPTANAIQPSYAGGSWDAFVTKINANGTGFVYSTYLGGNSLEGASSIAADSAGNAYVTGYTHSANFPTSNAIQSKNGGSDEAFVTSINADGSALVYSTYLGGKLDDYGSGIAADAAGSAFVIGRTYSPNFPKTVLAFQPSLKGGESAFVAKIASQTFVLLYPPKAGYVSQTVGTPSTPKEITLNNTGASSLTINKIYLVGANAGDFAETSGCPATLAAGAFCNISVTFTPTDKNTRKGLLAISDSDPASPQAAALTGTGTFVSLSAKSLSFGKVPVGTTSSPKKMTLTNVGSTQLDFTGISITGTNAGDFSQTNTCGTSIAGGASCTITVTFTPTATGTRKAAASISDDGGGSPRKVNLIGTGSTTAATTTTLSSSLNPSAYGQAVTFTATVTSSIGSPPPDGKTISFMKGTTVLGTGTLSGGSASFMTSTLPVGTNAIKAMYGGDSNFPGSTSKAVSQVVSKATTTTTLASSQNPSNVGQSVTFTASVAPQFSSTVKGTVTFYDGTTALKTVYMSGGAAKFTTSTLASGTHGITATYNGSTNFVGSSASLTQTVN